MRAGYISSHDTVLYCHIQSKIFNYNHWTAKFRTHSMLVPMQIRNFPIQCMWSQFWLRMYSSRKIAPKIAYCRYMLIFLLKTCIWCPYGVSYDNCHNKALLKDVSILENTLVQWRPILIIRLTQYTFPQIPLHDICKPSWDVLCVKDPCRNWIKMQRV